MRLEDQPRPKREGKDGMFSQFSIALARKIGRLIGSLDWELKMTPVVKDGVPRNRERPG